MQVKPGYKQSEVGVIPEDWNVIEASDLDPFITSGSRGWAKYYSDRGALFMRITNLSRASIYPDLSDQKLVNLPNHETEGLRTSLKDGDILISITADIGIIGYISKDIPKPVYINQHIACLRLPSSKADSLFQSYYLASYSPQKRFAEMTDIGAKSGINLTTVGKLKLVSPPFLEQQAIAQALSDADAFIESLEKLITKKRQIRQGVMQGLLSGKQRLRGFKREWKKKPVLDIAPLQRGFDLPNSKLRPGRYPVVYSNGILCNHALYQVKGPGVVTGRYGTIGTVTFVDADFWPHNTSLWVTTFKDNDPKFIYYLYTHIGFERFATGSGVPTLNRNDLHTHNVKIPTDKHEQSAIAVVLSDIDAEIATLETKLAKARQIKRGMSQVLLTGRIRLV